MTRKYLSALPPDFSADSGSHRFWFSSIPIRGDQNLWEDAVGFPTDSGSRRFWFGSISICGDPNLWEDAVGFPTDSGSHRFWFGSIPICGDPNLWEHAVGFSADSGSHRFWFGSIPICGDLNLWEDAVGFSADSGSSQILLWLHSHLWSPESVRGFGGFSGVPVTASFARTARRRYLPAVNHGLASGFVVKKSSRSFATFSRAAGAGCVPSPAKSSGKYVSPSDCRGVLPSAQR